MRWGFLWKLGANLSFAQKLYEKVVEVLGEGAPFEHVPLPAGYPCEELLVLKCLEKGQGDRFLEEFSFPRGTPEEFCLHLEPLCGEYKCTSLCTSWNRGSLTTYISSSVLRVFCVPLLTPQSCGCGGFLATCGLKQSCWGLCVCVYRNSRLENERLRGSNSFRKVWEYGPEKGREIFLKLYQCFTRIRIADRAYWQSSLRINVAV